MVLELNCLTLNPVCSLTNSKWAIYLAFLDLILPAYQIRKLEPTQEVVVRIKLANICQVLRTMFLTS